MIGSENIGVLILGTATILKDLPIRYLLTPFQFNQSLSELGIQQLNR